MATWKKLAPAVLTLGVGAGVGVHELFARAAAENAKQDLKPAVSLPLTRVVLFNSGVGYFSRSGEVDGDARVDLTFPESDVNDLLKSMVLEDFSKTGRVSAVSYDSREPIARTLASFAVNLNGNPTFAGVLSQLRGERVEVQTAPTGAGAAQPGKLTGSIVGLERQKVPAGSQVVDADVLNLWCADGMRSVRLSDVQSLRFSNPVIETEFRRALETLALSHDSQKKAVQLHFAGDGKRKVQVGYVIEAPIWKTSYRLLLDADNKTKPYLQGWAMVENPTDEDWNGVKMALVSGRPISFKMDLYNPLYINRPTVEPELFASLRPVTYRGDMSGRQVFNFSAGQFGGQAGNAAGIWNAADAIDTKFTQRDAGTRRFANYAQTYEDKQAPLVTAAPPLPVPPAPKPEPSPEYRKAVAEELRQGVGRDAVGNAATAAALGDVFQYTIDHPVTLGRQKSALLPIVGKEIEGQRVSIYNAAVQAKHPLLGLRFKNTSGAHLNQGPITVFEGSVYAGDTRVLDVQPGEERLVSYAVDLGTEVDPKAGAGKQTVTSVKAVRGIVTTVTKVSEETAYKLVNRSQTNRTVLVEHPNRTTGRFKLVGTAKPQEETPEVYRFQIALAAGETTTFTVKEEREDTAAITLTNGDESQIRYVLSLSQSSPGLKKVLDEALKLKGAWDVQVRELGQVNADLARLSADQERLRKNLREVPKDSEVYGRYLKKLDEQEKEIDALTAKQKALMGDEFKARKRYEDFLTTIEG